MSNSQAKEIGLPLVALTRFWGREAPVKGEEGNR